MSGRDRKAGRVKYYLIAILVGLIVVVFVARGRKSADEAAIVEAGGVIRYEWTGPDWLEPLSRKTGVGLGYRKQDMVVFSGLEITDAKFSNIKMQGESLFLRCPSLTVEAAHKLKSLESVRTLSLSTANVDDDWIEQIASMSNLEQLFLRGTRVTDKSINAIISLKKLRAVDVGLTLVSPDGVTRLAEMPSLESLGMSSDQASESLRAIRVERAGKLFLDLYDEMPAEF